MSGSPRRMPPEAETFLQTPAGQSQNTIQNVRRFHRWLGQEGLTLPALDTSDVVRHLGGAVFRAPDTLQTAYNPAIRESDPQFGVEGALSAFDAEFSSTLFFEKNDRVVDVVDP